MPDTPSGSDNRNGAGSWLEGSARPAGQHAGARLGLPESGPGSMAPLGRRVLALCIDWALSLVISAGFFTLDPSATLGIFAVQAVVLVGTLGHTVGHRLLGIGVRPLHRNGVGGAPGLLRALVRTVLICLVVPAVVWPADGRGLHDKAAGTVLVRR